MPILSKDLAGVIGEALFYASISSAIASVEMSSKFSVKNFSTNQEVLQNAADALRGYIIIGTIWAVATILVLYSSYGITGAIWALISNLLIMGWIVITYIQAFKSAANKNNLKEPYIFFP